MKKIFVLNFSSVFTPGSVVIGLHYPHHILLHLSKVRGKKIIGVNIDLQYFRYDKYCFTCVSFIIYVLIHLFIDFILILGNLLKKN